MSRNIKIRFWDKTTNIMIYPIENYETICIVEGKMKPSLNNSIIDNQNWYKREYEPLEYTGLKDKNEKEIYEGDIVRMINDSVDEENEYFLVEFESESARYVLSGDGLVYDFDNIFGDECEVVGNIYENSELLEEK